MGTADPHRSIYAFEIPEDSTFVDVVSKKDVAEGYQASEPLDLTPEQLPFVNVLESSNKTVKLNNVEIRRISRQCESDSKSNISSTINNNLKEDVKTSACVMIEGPEIGPVYGPHLEHELGGGDTWTTDKGRPVDLTSNDKDDWKSCTICLEEVEKGLKNHKGCSCFLCDSCIEVN